MPPARVHQGYQLLKAADPSRPVFVCLDTIPPTASAGPLWHDYLNATDVVISDTYPVGNVDAKPADRNVLAVYNTIATYKNYTPPGPAVLPPVVVVPNAFGGGEVWPREPSPAEERAMSYLGVVAGADGVSFFTHDEASQARPETCCYGSTPHHTTLWDACRTIAAELTELSTWFLASETRKALVIESDEVIGAKWVAKGCTLAIWVNTASTPVATRVHLPGAEGNVSVVFGPAPGWKLHAEDGEIQDSLEPLGVRIVRFCDEQPLDNPTTAPPAIDPSNILLNPSFEDEWIVRSLYANLTWFRSSAGVPEGLTIVGGGPGGTDIAARCFADCRDSVEGLHSLRITSPRPDGGGVRFRAAPPGPVRNDTDYELSFWARAAPVTANGTESPMSLRVVMGDGLPTDLLPSPGESFSLTRTWQRFSHTVKPTFTQRKPPIYGDMVRLSYGLEGHGTMWLDLLQLAPVSNIRAKSDDGSPTTPGYPGCPCADASLCAPLGPAARAKLAKRTEVYAFYGQSIHVNATDCGDINSSPSYWLTFDWDIVTTVAINGAVDPSLICYAHSRGVRVVQMTGCNGGPCASDGGFTTPAERAALLAHHLALMRGSGFDGISL